MFRGSQSGQAFGKIGDEKILGLEMLISLIKQELTLQMTARVETFSRISYQIPEVEKKIRLQKEAFRAPTYKFKISTVVMNTNLYPQPDQEHNV